MPTQPFSVLLDANNDVGIEIMFPIKVCIFIEKFGMVMTQFFDMNLLQGRGASKAEHMFNSIDDQFTKYAIKWD